MDFSKITLLTDLDLLSTKNIVIGLADLLIKSYEGPKLEDLAMQMSVVPINYEWVLNCLGSYSLDTIYDLLLFPAALLPPIVTTWPPELVSRDDE